jgi:hypothetical protein
MRAGLLAAAIVLATAAAAGASCPPFRDTGSPLEEALRQGASPLIVSPPSGRAPLDVDVRWWNYPHGPMTRFDFDFHGDGRIDETTPMEGEHYPRRQYRFASPGRYTVTVHLHDARGGVTRPTRTVEVFAPDAFDRALRRRDVPGALNCIVSASRDEYEAVFRRLFATGTTNVDGVLTTIRFVESRRASATYEMVSGKDGQDFSFEVRFAIDADGVWRIEAF